MTVNTAGLEQTWTAARERHVELRRAALELLRETSPQPLVTDEVAYVLDISVSCARSLLRELADESLVSARVETSEERTVRYGAPGFATRSTLYAFGSSAVSSRTRREAVNGFVVVRATRSRPRKRGDTARRIERALHSRPQSAAQLAAKTGCNISTVRTTLTQLESQGRLVVHRSGTNGRNIKFTARKTLTLTPKPTPAPSATVPAVTESQPSTPSAVQREALALFDKLAQMAADTAQSEIAVLTAERDALAERNATLEAAIAGLRNI